jgi:hypothetical protein
MAQANPAILGSAACDGVTLGRFIASQFQQIFLKCSTQVRHRNIL